MSKEGAQFKKLNYSNVWWQNTEKWRILRYSHFSCFFLFFVLFFVLFLVLFLFYFVLFCFVCLFCFFLCLFCFLKIRFSDFGLYLSFYFSMNLNIYFFVFENMELYKWTAHCFRNIKTNAISPGFKNKKLPLRCKMQRNKHSSSQQLTSEIRR